MTAVQAQAAVIPSFDTKVKMESRKRLVVDDADDLAPSRKRLIKDENGQAMKMNDDKEKDVEVRVNRFLRYQYPRDYGADAVRRAELPERCHHTANEGTQAEQERS